MGDRLRRGVDPPPPPAGRVGRAPSDRCSRLARRAGTTLRALRIRLSDWDEVLVGHRALVAVARIKRGLRTGLGAPAERPRSAKRWLPAATLSRAERASTAYMNSCAKTQSSLSSPVATVLPYVGRRRRRQGLVNPNRLVNVLEQVEPTLVKHVGEVAVGTASSAPQPVRRCGRARTPERAWRRPAPARRRSRTPNHRAVDDVAVEVGAEVQDVRHPPQHPGFQVARGFRELLVPAPRRTRSLLQAANAYRDRGRPP